MSWHETTVPLPAVSDYAALKAKLLAANWRGARAHTAPTNAPQVQMRLAGGHMEALIRYPVSFTQAAEIDERVAQAVLGTLAQPRHASAA